jgi:TolB-like protein
VRIGGGSSVGSPGYLRVGIVAADVAIANRDGIHEAAKLADGLAGAADPNEIVVTADVATEFVAGVDGDVEDLGDLALVSGSIRAYRLRPSTGMPAMMIELGKAELRPSIAILPFEDQVPADPDDMLGEALADDVITCLSRSPEFSVISGLSSRRLRRCGLTPENMAGCLAATYLLTGSYRSASGRISINVHLQDARRGTVLRSMHMEMGVQEAFDLTDPLGHRIAQEVGQAIFNYAVQQSKVRPLPELENYSLLMGAIGLMHRAAVQEFERARAMLEHLAQRHGCAGVAAAWLAKWHVLRVVQGWSPDASVDAQHALDYVERALEEDSRDALALSIGGLVHAYLRKDLHTAGQLYEEAIDANPSEPLAWLFTATRNAYLGEGPEAEAAGERALRLSPIDPLKYFFDSLAATASLANSNLERAVALSHRSLKANRTHASTWRTLAIALVMLNKMDEARAAVQRLLAIEPGLTVGRFRERFPGRDGPLAEPFAEALKVAGVPE